MSESLAIGEMLRQAMGDRYGEAELAARFRAFDTICSATQERQDAIIALLAEQRPDLAIVIGGYNSSNTCNLARICAEPRPPTTSRTRLPRVGRTSATARWAPRPRRRSEDRRPAGFRRARQVGLTAGASTPNNIIGQVVERLEQLAGAEQRRPPPSAHWRGA